MGLKIAIVVAVALAVGYLLLIKNADVGGTDARRLVEAGARLVDVRSAGEFAAGHIPGAINIPVQEIWAR